MYHLLLFLFIVLLAMSPSNVLAKQIEAKLHCKITDQIILEDNAGKPKRYNGYKDSHKVGDTLVFSVSLQPGIYESEKELGVIVYSLKWKDNGIFFSTTPNKLQNKSTDIIVTNGEYDEISLGKDFIRYEGIFVERFTLSRYYRDDWSGSLALTHLGDLNSGFLTMTIDCRTKSATTISDIFDAAVKMHQVSRD